MRTIFTKLLILGLAKFLLVTVFILLASISFGQTTENYDGAGTSNNQVLANGFAAFDYGGFTYQIISFNGANSSLLEILNWETYGNNGTDAIGVVGDENNKITVFKLTKTDGSAFSTSSLWMTSAGDSYTITGYNDGNTTGQSVSVSASFSGIKTLNFTGVDELRFEGTEIIVDLDDFTYTLGAANSAPTASSFTASPIYEGTSYVFATSDFSYSDGDGDPLDHIRITTVPGNGDLWVDSDGSGTINGAESALSNNGTISKANLDAGYLKYLNTNGTSSSFTFDVNDGTDYSATTYTATLTVTPEPTVTLSLDPSSSVSENAGSTFVKATLSNTFNKTVSVNLLKSGTTSVTDYSLSSTSISITSGNTTGTATITGVDDALDEANETVIIDISSVTNGTESGTQQVTCTLTDDDNTPVVTASQSFSISENIANSGAVGTVLATDGDVGTSFSAWTETGGTGASIFEINTSSGTITVTDNSGIDYETTTSYTYIVTVSDGTNTSAAETITINITDINDVTPVITASQSFSIAENIANSGAVGIVLATDGDAGTSFSAWTETGGTGASIFEINTSSGTITVTDNSGIDYETTTSYTYTLTVSDGTNTSAVETITINVTDVNDVAPIVTASQTFNIDEDASNTTLVGTVLATDGDVAATAFSSWTITAGNTNSVFAINSSTGEILVNDANELDYESITSYNLSITVSDGVNTSTAETVVVDLNAINDETPVFTSASTINIDENTTDVITLTATDSDAGTTFTFNKIGGDDQALFTINSSTGELAFTSSPDYETPLDVNTDNDYIVEVSVSDGLNSSTQTITVSVDNVTGITITSNGGEAIAEISIPENSTSIATVTSVNEGVTVPSYSLIGGDDQAKFNIHPTSGLLNFVSAPDYELAQDVDGNNSYEVIVRVTGDVGATDDQTITVTITDMNDVIPVITASQSFSVNEDAANTTSVGTVLATDGDAASTTYSSWSITDGNTDGIFAVNSTTGEITVTDNTNLDFEIQTTYSLTVTVSDGTNTSVAETVTVNVNGVNDNSPVVTASQIFNIAEDIANSGTVGTVLATDADAGTSFSAWTETGGTGASIFEINASTGVITVTDNSGLDYETTTSYSYTVTVSDGTNTSAAETITINITDVNDVNPVITASQTFNIDENSANATIVGTVLASDGDVTVTTYSGWTITAGNTNAVFAINSSTGELIVNDTNELDYESATNYNLTVTVSDGVNTSASETVVVNVNDLNDNRPVIEGNQTFSLDENPVKGTIIGNIAVTDADILETIYSNWTITNFVDPDGNGNNAISIHPETGELTVNDPLDFDFEKAQSFSLLIKVSDGTDFGSEEEVFININNLNDNAPAITGNQTFSINENAINATSVGTVLATDSDAGTTLTDWTIISGNEDGIFTITPSTGEITIVDNTNLDFERDETYDLGITVKDGENTSLEGTVRISVIDINEAPTAIQLSNATIVENSAIGTEVGTLTASDEDKDPTLSFSMTQNEFFELHGDKIVSKEIFDYEDRISYLIQINVADQEGLSCGESFTIQIENRNEAPEFFSEPIVHATMGVLYLYEVEYQDVDADGCLVSAYEKPDWLNLEDHGNGTCTLSGTPTEAGNFKVILEARDNEYLARQEFEIIVEKVTTTENTVCIYPNPVADELHIDISDFKSQELNLSLYSMTGSLIFKEDHQSVGGEIRIVKSVQQLRSGVYFLIIEFEGHRENYKIIKQ